MKKNIKGIVTNKNFVDMLGIKGVFFYSGKTRCYYYVGSTGQIKTHIGERFDASRILFKDLSKLEKGGTLHITLDCEKWTLTFEKPMGKVLGNPIEIEKNVYYPAICMHSCLGKYGPEKGRGFDLQLIF